MKRQNKSAPGWIWLSVFILMLFLLKGQMLEAGNVAYLQNPSLTQQQQFSLRSFQK